MEQIEIWKDIHGYEGKYQISNDGKIKSVGRWQYVNTNGYRRYHKETILKPRIKRNGYASVALTDLNGKTHEYLIHRLVAGYFVINKNNLPQVNHINGIKTDNRAENLEWITSSENLKHAYKIGLKHAHDGNSSKPIVAIKNGEIYGKFTSIKQMCRNLNLNQGGVYLTIKGRYTHHKGFTFQFIDNQSKIK